MLLSNPFLSGKTFDSEWKNALKTIKSMLNQTNVPQPEWQALFEIMNGLVTWIDNGSERIAAELTKELEKHIVASAKSLPTQGDDHALLTAYVHEWVNYMLMVDYLPKPFYFLTRNTNNKMHPAAKRPPTFNQNPVRQNMLSTWYRLVFNNVKQRLLKAAMELIRKDREGEHVEKFLIENVRKSFVELYPNETEPLELYRQEYEKAYYENLASFYQCRTADYMEKHGILSYIAYADKKLMEELDRASKYLERGNADTEATLLQKCLEVLYNNYEEQILAECVPLIKANDIEKLQMIYRVAHRTANGNKTMKDTLFHYIRREGLDQMIQNAEAISSDCDKYVEQLLEMHGRFTRLVKEAFNNDSKYLTERDKAFKEIVNSTEVFKLDVSKNYKGPVESRSPELLAIYCDQLLRKSAVSKRLTSEEVDEKLNNIILVLKYVQNKDVFMRFHKLHLSRRLILETTSDQEKEETLVRQFREIGMPADYVNKLSRMLQDIEINKDTNSAIKRTICQNNNNDTISIVDMMSLKILNVGAWGKSRYNQVTLPREIEDCSNEIQEVYKRMHVGRKLYWSPHMSSATIVINNTNGKYDLDVSALQLSVLNAFNNRPTAQLTFDDLKIATELLDADLNRTLMSLVAFPKLKRQLLLTNCQPLVPKNFTDSTLFWINGDFGITKNEKIQPRGRLNLIGRLNVIADATTDQECDEVIRLRCFRLQEAIIKIMKARRKISSAQLEVELVEQLKHMFLPSKKLIKEQIEWLIDNKYMARDENDMNIFSYTT
uniref:Cullin-5 n=1 Tax=Panagrolaimus superbus TaxID=310955 RepID=A0A914Y272_9BILA